MACKSNVSTHHVSARDINNLEQELESLFVTAKIQTTYNDIASSYLNKRIYHGFSD